MPIPDHINPKNPNDWDALADWLASDVFEPAPDEWRDATPLRDIRAAAEAIEADERRLTEAVAAARAARFSWRLIARFLGVSHQAAQKRFGTPARTG
ncbi:MAG: hypothetical protein ACRD0U_06425 [Acidimicrobiales bacterium]